MVLWWHLQVKWGVDPLGKLWIICIPGALSNRHLAARYTLPVGVVHTNQGRVVWGLFFTGGGSGRSGPGACGAGRGEAMGYARVQSCYSHHLVLHKVQWQRSALMWKLILTTLPAQTLKVERWSSVTLRRGRKQSSLW